MRRGAGDWMRDLDIEPYEAPSSSQEEPDLRLGSRSDERALGPRLANRVEGWHEAVVDLVKIMTDMRGRRLFVVEGKILRSTALNYAGQGFAHVIVCEDLIDREWVLRARAVTDALGIDMTSSRLRQGDDLVVSIKVFMRVVPKVTKAGRTVFFTTFERCE